jgi:hypothetical protein
VRKVAIPFAVNQNVPNETWSWHQVLDLKLLSGIVEFLRMACQEAQEISRAKTNVLPAFNSPSNALCCNWLASASPTSYAAMS